MELGPLARLLIWLLNRCPSISFIQLDSTQSSPSSRPAVSTLDPDLLTEDLKDPNLRIYYVEFLEACLTMPASRYKR
jgi:hypothetical protein